MRTNSFIGLLLGTTLLLYMACYDDFECIVNPDIPGNGANVVFALKTPGVSSRALTPERENEIETLDVLVFSSTRFVKAAPATLISETEEEQLYSVSLPPMKCDLMLLANCRREVGNIPADATREMIAKGLSVSVEGRWNATYGSAGYRAIPMWAIKDTVTIEENTRLMGERRFQLMRMTASVQVNLQPKAQENFKLTSIRYYNYDKKGRIIPCEYEREIQDYEHGFPELKPILMETPEVTWGPLIYTNEEEGGNPKTDIPDNVKCENTIYVFEGKAGNATDDPPTYPFLVVGGYYEEEDTETFYRVNFGNPHEETGEFIYFPILRNYRYMIRIDSVYGSGQTTPEKAIKNTKVELEASVMGWDEETMGIGDGQYFLKFSGNDFHFTQEGRDGTDLDNRLTVETSHPNGVTLVSIDDESGQPVDWLKPNKQENGTFIPVGIGDTGPANEPFTWWLFATDYSQATPPERTAILTLRAGRMEEVIKVTQTNESVLWIKIYKKKENGELEEVENATYMSLPTSGIEDELVIRWFPEGAEVTIQMAPHTTTDYVDLDFREDARPENTIDLSRDAEEPGTYLLPIKLKKYLDLMGNEVPDKHEEFNYRKGENLFTVKLNYKNRLLDKEFAVRHKYLGVSIYQENMPHWQRQQRYYNIDVDYNTPFTVSFEDDNGNSLDHLIDPVPLAESKHYFYGGPDYYLTEPGEKEGPMHPLKPYGNEIIVVPVLGAAHNGRAVNIVVRDTIGYEYFRRSFRIYHEVANCILLKLGEWEEFAVTKPFYVWGSLLGVDLSENELSVHVL
ncbi:MAG: hypothetical protein LUD15_09690 [Bacteroides sp.]|nr:hypothetical protein [Bacteroides sp.]